MMEGRIHANDGVDKSAEEALTAKGFKVSTNFVEQDKLVKFINDEKVEVLLVRSATKFRKEHMDACPSLRAIGRGGVGMDNIDVQYGRDNGLVVFNTPNASSSSVAELVMARLFDMCRHLYDADREMPAKGHSDFKTLKSKYKGSEVRGKTLGVIGFGRIGKWTARYALGNGMNVIASDTNASDPEPIAVKVGNDTAKVYVPIVSKDELLAKSDMISLHVPAQSNGSAIIGKAELAMCKKGVFIVNTARGGSIDEDALLEALDNGTVAAAALDVFTNEPTPREDLLKHPRIATSPHIAAATNEAQERIGEELVENIIEICSKAEVKS